MLNTEKFTTGKMMVPILSSDCFVVKGYVKSSIYDLGRRKMFSIPHKIANLINENRIIEFKNIEKNKYREYYNLLINHEIIYEIPKKVGNNFIEKSTNFQKYFSIHTLTLFVNDINDVELSKLTKIYFKNHCIKVFVIIIEVINEENMFEFMESLVNTSLDKVIIISNKNIRLHINKQIEVHQHTVKVKNITIKQLFIDNQHKSILRYNLVIHREVFSESLIYNVYFNGKVYLNEKLEPFYDYNLSHPIPINN